MATETIRTHRAHSKTARAKDIFAQMIGYPRQMVIKRYEEELSLTPKGASTYYQSQRKALGMVRAQG
jgi:hypothetical protein